MIERDMWLKELAVKGFRNLDEQKVEFSPRANLVFGANGSGKTNLLEAISILATGRSFRTIRDNQMLGFYAPYFNVSGRVKSERNKTWQGRVYFSPKERKHYFLDTKEVPKRALFAGWLPVSIFLLDDRRLVAGAPAQRRCFVDDAVGKVSRTYRFVLSEFRRVLAHRNALLKKGRPDDEFEVWEERLVKLAQDLEVRREEYWKKFKVHFTQMSTRFLPSDKLAIRYVRDIADGGDYGQILERERIKERKIGFTRRGPHRDDFRVLLNARPIRSFGSYGQQRLAALALALAEAHTALEAGKNPVFLMDDVAAELDDHNEKLLFESIGTRCQIFYAAARPPAVEGQRFHVGKGKVKKV